MFYIASDHAGFSLKEKIKAYFLNIQWEDLGTNSPDRVDYPDYADRLCKKMEGKQTSFGILICGSGQGMCIRANRYSYIRAALCWDKKSAELSRQHNDANVLCLGERLLSPESALEIVKTFLKTEFEGGRHADRVAKLNSSL